MNIKKNQMGVGMVEILVALLILAIGILGFIALQYRAVEATAEGTNRVQAVNLARDLAERIRINHGIFSKYQTELQTAANQETFTKNCFNEYCNSSELADFDVSRIALKARSVGMTINLLDCQGTNNGRQCIYVAWNDTSATDGTGTGDCTSGTNYNPNSTCLIMEIY